MTALLVDFDSLCEKRQKEIVSRDRGSPCEHRAANSGGNLVRQYKIDGVVIKDGIKCDFLLLNDEKKTAYYIELKGSDILKAIQQVEETARRLGRQLLNYTQLYRIVYRTGTLDLHSGKVTEWKARNRGKQIIRSSRLEEAI